MWRSGKARRTFSTNGQASPAVRVGIAGILGRMGRVAARAIDAAPGLELRAGFARGAGSIREELGFDTEAVIFDDIDAFVESGLDVVIDFTVYPVSTEVARGAIASGVNVVVGSTGWTDEDEVSFADACDTAAKGALIVPNFSIGAVLMMRFAEEAVQHILTARRIAAARELGDAVGSPKIPIHSVRLPGLVAHQAVMFGARGETLTIRHDTVDRDAYAEGIVLATRRVSELRGLQIGLDVLLFGVPDPMEGPI